MKFVADKKLLAESLSRAGRAVRAGAGGLFVLIGVRVEADSGGVTFVGSDLDTTIRCYARMDVETAGVMVAPSKLLADVAKAMPDGPVTVETVIDEAAGGTPDEVRISGGRSEFSLRLLPAADYPEVPAFDDIPSTVLAADGLLAAVKQTSRAASSDDSRPVLTGVLLRQREDDGGLRLVSTDSYRLALRDLPGVQAFGDDREALVSGGALDEMVRLLGDADEVRVSLGDRVVQFEADVDIGWVQISSRLIAGDYPNFEPLFPDESAVNRLTVDRVEMLASVRRMRLMGKETNAPLRIAATGDSLELTVISQDVGGASETIEASFDGDPLNVAYNPQYLLDGLESLTSDTVTLSRVDELKPAVLSGDNDQDGGYRYLLMPVRVT